VRLTREKLQNAILENVYNKVFTFFVAVLLRLALKLAQSAITTNLYFSFSKDKNVQKAE